jgi:Zn-dependent M28 family amino/carboxypeptidase
MPLGDGLTSRRAGLLAGALALGTVWRSSLAAQTTATVDSAALMAMVRVLAADSMEGRKLGTPGGARARHYLVQRLEALGIAPLGKRFEHAFAVAKGNATGVNVLGMIPGTKAPRHYIVLSAHYDHLGIRGGEIYNGADDNASGTAAVLAIAGSIRRHPLAHSLIIALFDGEEEGLLGARAFVAAPPPPVARAAIALNLNLDMVGHSERGELWAAGAARYPALRPVLEELQAQAPVHLLLGHDRPDLSGQDDWTNQSDQGAFHAAGIPFVYFGVEDHRDYHRPSDDPPTLTPVFYAGAVSTILTALRAFDLRLSSRAGTSP